MMTTKMEANIILMIKRNLGNELNLVLLSGFAIYESKILLCLITQSH